MATPTSMLAFMVANVVAWPGIAILYWYQFQREEESLMADLASAAAQSDDGTGSGEPANSEA